MNSITQDRLKEIFHYNQDTGEFTRITSHNRWKAGDIAGYVNSDGYLEAGIDKRYYGLHRLAWLYITGELPRAEIDHINGIKSDNRFCNLRQVSKAMNSQNLRSARKDNKCGMLGVNWHNAAKAWVAQISISGKKKHLGIFLTAEEAHQAYLSAKRKIHEGCTI